MNTTKQQFGSSYQMYYKKYTKRGKMKILVTDSSIGIQQITIWIKLLKNITKKKGKMILNLPLGSLSKWVNIHSFYSWTQKKMEIKKPMEGGRGGVAWHRRNLEKKEEALVKLKGWGANLSVHLFFFSNNGRCRKQHGGQEAISLHNWTLSSNVLVQDPNGTNKYREKFR